MSQKLVSNAIYVGDSCLATVEEGIIAMHYCDACVCVCTRVYVCVREIERAERGSERRYFNEQ